MVRFLVAFLTAAGRLAFVLPAGLATTLEPDFFLPVFFFVEFFFAVFPDVDAVEPPNADAHPLE